MKSESENNNVRDGNSGKRKWLAPGAVTVAGLTFGLWMPLGAAGSSAEGGIECGADEYRISSHAMIDFIEEPDYIDKTPAEALGRLFKEYPGLDQTDYRRNIATIELAGSFNELDLKISQRDALDASSDVVPDVIFERDPVLTEPAMVVITLTNGDAKDKVLGEVELVRTRSGWTPESVVGCESLLFGTRSASELGEGTDR